MHPKNLNYLIATSVITTLLIGAVYTVSASSFTSVKIDLTGSGGLFDFDAPSGTADLQTFIFESSGGTLVQAGVFELELNAVFPQPVLGDVNATGGSLGINSPGSDSTDQIEADEALSFAFNFDGSIISIDASDFSAAGGDVLTIESFDPVQTQIGTDIEIFNGSNTALVSPLAFVNDGFVAFTSVGNGVGLQSITIQIETAAIEAAAIPSPAAFGFGAAGMLALVARRRRRDTR